MSVTSADSLRHVHPALTPHVHARPSRGRRTRASRPARACSGTDAVSPPDSTIAPASMRSPRAASASASQTSAAAGWPMTAPPAAVSIAPRHRKTQPRTLRSTSSSGGAAAGAERRPARRRRCRPRSPAAGRDRSSASPRSRWPGTTASVAASTPATVVGASIRFPIRNAISGSARGWMSSSSCSGSPCGSTMPDVSRPNTGSSMPSACRLTRLVSPSFAPMSRSPASSRCSTTSAWAS